jgi:outer membrane lipoprotein-sorting protein
LINYPEYKYIEYVTGKGETVSSIAYKFNTSDFKIRYKNELSSYFGTIKEGKKLLIPTPYSNKTIVYIDKKTFIPVCVKVYDEEGLFEAYEFYNIRLNTTFAADEFSKNYKDYGF